MNHIEIMLNSWEYFKLKYSYEGYLGKHNKPNYPAVTYLFSNVCSRSHHFSFSLN